MLTGHDQRWVILDRFSHLALQPLIFLVSRIVPCDRAVGIARPTRLPCSVPDAGRPTVDRMLHFLAAHSQPPLVHVHDAECVGFIRFLSDEMELTATGADGIKDVKSTLDESSLNIPTGGLGSYPEHMRRD